MYSLNVENLEKFLVMTAFCLGMEKLACLWFIFKWITHHIWIKSTVISEDFSFTFFFLYESRETRLRSTQIKSFSAG